LKRLKEYRIAFSGLSLGKHDFGFEVDQKFFDCFEYSIVKDGKLDIEVVLDKKSNMMVADFRITGFIMLTCDVCLKSYKKPTDIQEQLIIKFQPSEREENLEVDEILVLTKQDYDFSIAEFLYEQINLSVPFYGKCEDQNPEESCDPEMKKALDQLAPSNQDHQSEANESDPRWDASKNLNRNN
jgi:uncharacterized protein